MGGWQRLRIRDVQPGTGELSGLQRRHQRVGVGGRAAADAQEVGPTFGSRKERGIKQFSRVAGQRQGIDDDIRLILERMPEYGLEQAVAFDLTRPEVGLPVVRVVVPKAEAWSVFHLHTGRGVFGGRVSKILHGEDAE